MAWIESHQALQNHPKTIDLMIAMDWDLDTTIGKLHRFWWWCVDYAENGDLTKHNDARLAMAVGLDAKYGKTFVEAMVQSGWIDREPYFRVHDWWDYIGLFLQRKYGDKKKDKWEQIRQLYNNCTVNCTPIDATNQPNLTNLTKDQPKTAHSVDKPVDKSKMIEYSKEFVNKAEMAKGLGVNIYELLGLYKKRSKVCEDIPEQVLSKVIDSIIKYKPREQFPYFLQVLKQESMGYFANNQQRSHEKIKKEPVLIGNLLSKMAQED